MTETEAKWIERVEQWRAGGKSAEEYAQGRGFEASTLRYWASRLKTKPPQGTIPPTSSVVAAETSAEPTRRDALRIVRIRRSKVSVPTEAVRPRPANLANAAVWIAIGAARIEVRRGFDRGLLLDVVDALGGRR